METDSVSETFYSVCNTMMTSMSRSTATRIRLQHCYRKSEDTEQNRTELCFTCSCWYHLWNSGTEHETGHTKTGGNLSSMKTVLQIKTSQHTICIFLQKKNFSDVKQHKRFCYLEFYLI
jgi:hypothetical protein